LTALALIVVAILLVYAICQTDWIVDVSPKFKKVVRAIFAAGAVVVAVLGYGLVVWPPVHRHTLSKAEREKFEEPLKRLRQPTMSVHLYCAPYDEVDCVYAAGLIPLFGEAGWDVSTMVERVTLGRPMPGIVIGVHGTVKPEDEPKLKWNQGEWGKITLEEEVVRQAFVNIGVEPDATSGSMVPENQINIYVGHERENESAPTEMTQTFKDLPRMRREHPEIEQEPGAK
jgi:hypothetical protein